MLKKKKDKYSYVKDKIRWPHIEKLICHFKLIFGMNVLKMNFFIDPF